MVLLPIARETAILRCGFDEFAQRASQKLARQFWLLREDRDRRSAKIVFAFADTPTITCGIIQRREMPIVSARLIIKPNGRDQVAATVRVGVEANFLLVAFGVLAYGAGVVYLMLFASPLST